MDPMCLKGGEASVLSAMVLRVDGCSIYHTSVAVASFPRKQDWLHSSQVLSISLWSSNLKRPRALWEQRLLIVLTARNKAVFAIRGPHAH